MSQLTGKAKEAANKLSDGLRVYNGRMIDSNDKAQIIEIMENCIRGLEWDDFRQLLEATPPGMYTEMMNEARNNIKKQWQQDMAAKAGAPLDHINRVNQSETEDEKQNRMFIKEKNFFFSKNKAHPRCNCGAGFTQFPNHHAHFCDAHPDKPTSKVITSEDFMD